MQHFTYIILQLLFKNLYRNMFNKIYETIVYVIHLHLEI